MNNIKLSQITTCYPDGFSVSIVKVETNIKKGIPRNIIVGQPDLAIKESIDRIKIAIENSGFIFPMQNLLINLSPAEFKKRGSFFDLPIIVSILVATKQIKINLDLNETVILGEVGLDGSIKRVTGILNILISLKNTEYKKIIIPQDNKWEASIITGIKIYPIQNIRQLQELSESIDHTIGTKINYKKPNLPEISLYQYQLIAFRGLQIAIAGRHHMMMIGSPGSGKTMISKLGKILQPPLDMDEIGEILRIESIQGNGKELIIKRPFRAPHHTSSEIAIVGGGNQIKMGEITLAHQGILYLDELAEFKPRVIQSLREPMEEQVITISRANGRITYPAEFLLFCSSNPCPCGYHSSREKNCLCSPKQVRNYISRFNGPFLDRIEIEIELYKEDELNKKTIISLNDVYRSICNAVERQKLRYSKSTKKYNGYCKYYMEDLLKIHPAANSVYKSLVNEYSLRKIHTFKKISRTIADLDESEYILEKHAYESLQYCNLQKLFLDLAA